jgi:hypothetical protein
MALVRWLFVQVLAMALALTRWLLYYPLAQW